MSARMLGAVFVALGLLFLGLLLRDTRKPDGGSAPARRAWRRLAVIFGAVGVWLVGWGGP